MLEWSNNLYHFEDSGEKENNNDHELTFYLQLNSLRGRRSKEKKKGIWARDRVRGRRNPFQTPTTQVPRSTRINLPTREDTVVA